MIDNFRCVTCTAPVNIAVIKYWGKRNEKLILPTNSSLSVTLGQDELRAKTSVATSSKFSQDRMWLNGKEQSVSSPRIQNVISEVRKRARSLRRKALEVSSQERNNRKRALDDGVDETKNYEEANPQGLEEESRTDHVHIVSENNFPTAAGLASSAAGYACLVYALCKLYGIPGEISDIARLGSGSACRSMYGGYVLWHQGQRDDGTDSLAQQLAPPGHWPQMHALVCVVSGEQKPVGSTAGMQSTVSTSPLFQHRLKIVPSRVEAMTKAIKERDFQSFATITMQESNQLHSVCLDTNPPIFYLTDTSRDIINFTHALNDAFGDIKTAYTFDAGPNACLYMLEKDVPLVMGILRHFFPPKPSSSSSFITGLHIEDVSMPSEIIAKMRCTVREGAIKYVIHTKVGPGPQVISDPTQDLINSDGSPRL